MFLHTFYLTDIPVRSFSGERLNQSTKYVRAKKQGHNFAQPFLVYHNIFDALLMMSCLQHTY